LAFSQLLTGGSIYEVYDLGQLGGNASAACGINSTGTTTGEATDTFGNMRAVSASGSDSGCSVLAGANPATASDLNGAGAIVGTQYLNGVAYATRWMNGSPQTMGGAGSYATGINESGQITGMATVNGQGHAFVTMPGGAALDMGVPAGGLWSAGYDVNASGQVAGYAMTGSRFRAFVWTEQSGYVTIGTFGGQNSYAMALNDAGVTAGHAQASNGHLRAFTWDGAAVRDWARWAAAPVTLTTSMWPARLWALRGRRPAKRHTRFFTKKSCWI
jgi:probable HAF family extracellular repeat protein